MQPSKKHENFYRIFMQQSREGIWLAIINPPLPLQLSEVDRLEHLYRYALIEDCNAVFAGMYGYDSPGKIIGKTLLAFATQDDKKNIETLKKFLDPPYSVEDGETHEVDKDGSSHWFLSNAVGIIEDDCMIGVWGVQKEITERKQIESERRRLNELLPLKQRMILQFEAEGRSVKEIANVLKLSPNTVYTHRARLMKRLNITDSMSLGHYAMGLQLSVFKADTRP